jgi:hypothetical protein
VAGHAKQLQQPSTGSMSAGLREPAFASRGRVEGDLMAKAHTISHEVSVMDEDREWGVQQCSHGCVHITLDRITMTFTELELYALKDLLDRACTQVAQSGIQRASGALVN